MDSDGDLDIVSGNNFGQFFYFENIGTASSPNFTTQVQGAFGLVESSFILWAPGFGDVDNDGDLDMFAGVASSSDGGTFYYFENTGTSTSPSFATPIQDPFNLSLPVPGFRDGNPYFLDFDGDGDQDLFSGSSNGGNLYYWENSGTPMAPNYTTAVENPFNHTSAGIRNTPDLKDIDNDGDLDILAGYNSGDFYYYENALPMPMTAIPDPVFEQYLINQGFDDIIDGLVVTANIESVTTIGLNGDGVTDLTGIEDFTALTILGIENNAVTSLNTSTLINLQELRIQNTDIAALDLSNNPLLNTLRIDGTLITDLDLSSNTSLISLTAISSLLTNLDLSNNGELVNLSLQGSLSLSNLDVTNNPLLQQLNASNCSLSEIDLFSNNLLETLDLSFNNIVNIDINQNTNLTTLFLNDNAIERPYLANGNNTLITNENFSILNNPAVCITVDDVTYSDNNWFQIDEGASFSTDCNGLWVIFTEDTNLDSALLSINDGMGMSLIDTNDDGEITYEEAQAFTGILQLNNRGIIDVTGLEAFTNANTLDLSDNAIVDINTFLTSESFIIESRNAANTAQSVVFRRPKIRIKSLNIARNNISEVDISKTEGMESLDVSGNPLTSLTLGGGGAGRFDGTDTNRSDDFLTTLIATNTGGLGCIQVSNVAAANVKVNNGSWQIDSGTIFSTNCAAPLSINDFSLNNSISIFPNPTDDFIEISLSNGIELDSVEIYDIIGKKVLNSSQNRIDIENLPEGIYILTINTSNGVLSKKIIKG